LRTCRHPFYGWLCWTVLSVWLDGGLELGSAGAEVDESKLPPAAPAQIDFARDVKPILEANCLRCHGPERPKNGFRLDNRAAALKGGDNGVDILPGHSSKSPLIHYAARVVPDMEMPPQGKGKPLTPQEVGILRAWIDQGVAWETRPPTNLFDVTISSAIGGVFVDGDQKKFREHYWRTDGLDGGIEHFELFQQIDPNTKALVTGHAQVNDYQLTLDIDRSDLGFIHSGWSQYRQYYDDLGGAFPTTGLAPLSLGQDLHLDIGKAWIDFGLTLPHWPRMVLGYEYDYKRGDEAITSWGFDGVPNDPRNIAPNSKHLDEGTHIIRFDLDGDVAGVNIQDQFRGEFYSLDTGYTNVAARAEVTQNAQTQDSYFQGANSIRLEKQVTDWLLGSGGYFYSQLNAEDSFTNAVTANGTLYGASVPEIVLERESHVFNLNALFGPFNGLTLSSGVQSEWTRQHGTGSGDLNGIAFTLPPGSNLAIRPAQLSSDYDESDVSETVGLRYSKIPFTSLFADGRFKQDRIGQSESDLQAPTSYLEKPADSSQLTDYRVGFSTSPWSIASLSAHYRRYEDDSRYRTNDVPIPVGGYPGFLIWRDLITDEVETKLTLRPASWLKATLSYQYLTTEYRQDTRPAFSALPPVSLSPGGELMAGQYDSHIYSLGLTFTPQRRLYLTTLFSYQATTTTTASEGLISPYKGGIYSALASGTYAFKETTDLSLAYSLSLADYGQPNPSLDSNSPSPLGIQYQMHAVQAVFSHRISKAITTRLQYGFFYYDEPSSLGAANYKAHMVFASLVYHFR
jgi:mono/diheme cytochrome c family protein